MLHSWMRLVVVASKVRMELGHKRDSNHGFHIR
jgi:hypothetical protein